MQCCSLLIVPDDLAVAHLQPARERARDLFVVGDQHEGRPFQRELVQKVDHLFAGFRVEVPGGLIGKDDDGPLGDRASDRDSLALAARELRRPVGQPVSEPDALERRASRRRGAP